MGPTRSAPKRTIAASALALAATVLQTGVAEAQGLAPALGTDVAPGDLRAQFEQAYGGLGGALPAGWNIAPAIDLQGAWVDPVQATSSNGKSRGSDVFVNVIPSVNITGSSGRFEGQLYAAPQFRAYLQNGNLDTVNANSSAHGRATLVPDTLFLDVSGGGTTGSRYGGYGGYGTTAAYNRNDSVTTYNYNVSPSIQHQFGDYGTAQAYYTFGQTFTNAKNGAAVTPFGAPISTVPVTNNTVGGSFTTGQYLNRITSILSVVNSNNTGGYLQGSHNFLATATNNVALDRDWTLLTQVGYQNLQYSYNQGYAYKGFVYQVGARWVPNADSSIQVTYGQQSGTSSFSVDSSYAPSARTRVGIRHTEGVTSQQERYQQAVRTGAINQNGQFVDPNTGLPLNLSNNFYGATSGAYRFTSTSGTITFLWERDVVSVTIGQDTNDSVGASPTNAPNNSTGTYGIISYQHDLNPTTTASTYFQYGQRHYESNNQPSNQNSVSFGASINKIFTPTLTGYARYSFTNFSQAYAGQSPTQNLLLVGLHKSF